MTERELSAAAVGIITYCSLCQTGEPPQIDSEEKIIEAAAFLDSKIFDTALQICSAADLDGLDLFEK
jgi:hypothetical protein